jgi:hypothetical protein
MNHATIISTLKDQLQYRITFNLDGTISSRYSHSTFNVWAVVGGQLVLINSKSFYLTF